MVILSTNRPDYWNDLSEVIRLLFGQTEIFMPGEAPAADAGSDVALALTAGLHTEKNAVLAEAATCGQTHSERLVLPSQDRLIVKRIEKRALKIAVFRLLKRFCGAPTPWGSLTGIRPTKLFRELSDAEGAAGAERTFFDLFDVSPEKTELAREICRVQRPLIDSVSPMDVDIYVDIPFCPSKCLYCSFPSEILSGRIDALTPYLAALQRDIEAGGELVRRRGYRVRCMYIGGGTPTVLSVKQLSALLQMLRAAYGSFGAEMTVEAGRPDTIDAEKLAALRTEGVDRISINPQTMNDVTLSRIGRLHDAAAIEHAFSLARDAGFSVINMDLIAGLPGEDINTFSESLRRVKALSPENLTVHSLALKRSSRLWDRLSDYPLPIPGEVERMILSGASAARDLHMVPYYMYRQKYMQGNLENVGYAHPDAVCMYNVDMMEETVSILAHGASAMTKRVFHNENRVERIPNPKDVHTYIEKIPELLSAKNALF